jgi:hypothetical protein
MLARDVPVMSRPRPARLDSRTGRPLRQYLALLRTRRLRVTVIGEATDLACREVVSEEFEDRFGAPPDFVAQVAAQVSADAEIVLGRLDAR